MSGVSINSPAVASKSPFFQNVSPFIIGGCSGMFAAVCVQPLDMIKVRLQLSNNTTTSYGTRPSSLTVVRELLADGKFLNFYNGLSAALARQIVYGTSRLGLFVTFEDALKRRAKREDSEYRFVHRVIASVSAGALAAAIGNPTEVALIRMQADGTLPINQRRNFKSVIDALIQIARQEGIHGLWGGCLPTVIRAMSTNFGQLAFFSESKHQLEVHTNLSDRARTLTASAIGGFCAAFFSMPFDTVKSRLQSSHVRKYRGMVDCFTKIARDEGLSRFYRGFPAYFSRLAPHSHFSGSDGQIVVHVSVEVYGLAFWRDATSMRYQHQHLSSFVNTPRVLPVDFPTPCFKETNTIALDLRSIDQLVHLLQPDHSELEGVKMSSKDTKTPSALPLHREHASHDTSALEYDPGTRDSTPKITLHTKSHVNLRVVDKTKDDTIYCVDNSNFAPGKVDVALLQPFYYRCQFTVGVGKPAQDEKSTIWEEVRTDSIIHPTYEWSIGHPDDRSTFDCRRISRSDVQMEDKDANNFCRNSFRPVNLDDEEVLASLASYCFKSLS